MGILEMKVLGLDIEDFFDITFEELDALIHGTDVEVKGEAA